MSKKYSNKKKVNVKVVNGQTVVVLPWEWFMHIAETYDYLATERADPEDMQWYHELADTIRFQSDENLFSNIEEYDEW